MKTYNEMTESVLKLARVRAAEQKRKRRRACAFAGAMLCVALVLAAATAVGKLASPTVSVPQQTETTGAIQPLAPKQGVSVYLLRNENGQEVREPLKAGVTMPVAWMVRVRDIRGLCEAAQAKALLEEEAFADAFRENNPAWGSFAWRRTTSRTIITEICSGFLSLDFEDFSQISTWDVETTGTGGVDRSHFISNCDMPSSIHLNWHLSDQTVQMLDKEPDTPLSTIRDAITVTIDYIDGSQEVLTFYITLDDEGHVFVTQKGATV